MGSKRRKMLTVWALPGVIAGIRAALTMVYLIWNPLGLPLRFFQVIALGVYIATSFSYFKLFRDGVPVISVVTPLLIHAIIIFVFLHVIAWQSLLPLFVIDILFLISKGVKSSLYPYDIDGEDEDDLSDVDEFLTEAG